MVSGQENLSVLVMLLLSHLPFKVGSWLSFEILKVLVNSLVELESSRRRVRQTVRSR